MLSPKQVVRFRPIQFILLSLASILFIGAIWFFLVCLTCAGLPFLKVPLEKFFDLGFFSISIFSLIIFLTMIPFQSAESKLSPGFYSRIYKTPLAHFGIYILIVCSIICFGVFSFHPTTLQENYSSQLYMAIVIGIIFAILLHRFWVLRCIYQPYIVSKYMKNLQNVETDDEMWLDLFECTHKAIQGGRVSDAKNYIDWMYYLYKKCFDQKKMRHLNEDLTSLYATAQNLRPTARFIEEKWPFLKKGIRAVSPTF